MKKALIILSIALIAGYVVFAVIKFSDKPEEELCKGMNVQVTDSASIQFIKTKDVELFLKKNRLIPVGKRIKDINTEDIECKLKTIPIIETAECYRSPDGIVHIRVTQRNPIMRIMSNSDDYYIDENSRIIPVSSNFIVFLPVATGNIDSVYAKTTLRDFAVFLKKSDFWTAQIEQIDVMPNKDVVLIPRVGDHQILLGSLDRFEDKLNRLMVFYQKGLSETGWNKYDKIDLKFGDQIICTKK
ncbi:MAG: hypothetical protein FWF54_00800 [Candidatus Azobacteroides sp.]|nr:hypothetical protein [Candidatus Azobacteroides sp.]